MLRAEYLTKQMKLGLPQSLREEAPRADKLTKQSQTKQPDSSRMAALRTEWAAGRSDRESRKDVHSQSQVSEDESHGQSATSSTQSKSIDREMREWDEIHKIWHQG